MIRCLRRVSCFVTCTSLHGTIPNACSSVKPVATGLPGGAGSDAHVPNAIGSAYVEMPPFSDAAEFLTCLRSATVIGHHWDEPRPWTPRIVPSVTLE